MKMSQNTGLRNSSECFPTPNAKSDPQCSRPDDIIHESKSQPDPHHSNSHTRTTDNSTKGEESSSEPSSPSTQNAFLPPHLRKNKSQNNLHQFSSRKRTVPTIASANLCSPSISLHPLQQYHHQQHFHPGRDASLSNHQIWQQLHFASLPTSTHFNVHATNSEESELLHHHHHHAHAAFMMPPPLHHYPPPSSSPPLHPMPYLDYYGGAANIAATGSSDNPSLPLHLSSFPHPTQMGVVPPPPMFDPIAGGTDCGKPEEFDAPPPSHPQIHQLSGVGVPPLSSSPPSHYMPSSLMGPSAVSTCGPAPVPQSSLFMEGQQTDPYVHYNSLVAQPGSCNPGPPLYFYPNTKRGPHGANLFVFHIPDDFTNRDMYELFGPHGTLVSVRIMTEEGSNRNLGYGFVSFSHSEDAANAILALNGCLIKNKRLKVQHKQAKGGKYRRRQRQQNNLNNQRVSAPLGGVPSGSSDLGDDSTALDPQDPPLTTVRCNHRVGQVSTEHRTATLSAVAHLANEKSANEEDQAAHDTSAETPISDAPVNPSSHTPTVQELVLDESSTKSKIDLKDISKALRDLNDTISNV
uniref:RRM domain-containing protein n=1 Tax=Corethron hystrix TaxID=216773 RepID=A0A7S1FTH5_9STRA|mmetsp:Transcript_30553/g.69916  ORF Transcript_30553/g.69916 Transcript_30553/m.69916 type:complete len:577 (+) Transcript_30553:226-1956(+)